MDYNALADLLFPEVTLTPEDMEIKYPERNLPEGAKVTRFAPSPTGFVHFGGLFPTRVSERLAHQSGGVFYLRIEDTDDKRKVEGAEQNLIEVLADYGIEFDEGVTLDGQKGDYGPYRQSERAGIYHVFAKYLVQCGRAYPCFCTREELDEIRKEQEESNLTPGYYGKWAKYRDADFDTVKAKIDAGAPYVLRFRSEGNEENKFKFTDLVKGDLELSENYLDQVLLKSDGIPTYHFAHAVDDHLMRTTHVVRGEEWLPSLPFHFELFRALGFRMPKYLHISQLMKKEGDSKKKLSKRDAGVDMRFYESEGYCAESVEEYIMTLLNSDYEEWRRANKGVPFTEFKFNIKKLSASGCLLDIAKLVDISKDVISGMTAEQVYEKAVDWAEKYDPDFAAVLKKDPEYTLKVLSLGRGGKKPRKDIAVWSELKDSISYFFDELYSPENNAALYDEKFDKNQIADILKKFVQTYDESDDNQAWFEKVRDISSEFGYCTDMKEYKQNPDKYVGSVADVSTFIRIAICSRTNSPDMHAIMHILGSERSLSRINDTVKRLEK